MLGWRKALSVKALLEVTADCCVLAHRKCVFILCMGTAGRFA